MALDDQAQAARGALLDLIKDLAERVKADQATQPATRAPMAKTLAEAYQAIAEPTPPTQSSVY